MLVLLGPTGTGKSTIALRLSKHLGLPWISTDQIGTVMRAVASRASHHDLFTWHDRDDFKYLDEETAGEIAALDLRTGEPGWKFETGSSFLASPSIAGGMLVIGDADGTLYAFGEKPASSGKGSR